MSETIDGSKNDNIGESFFLSGKGEKDKKPEKSDSKPMGDAGSFISKGSNRILDEPWNIHFTVGGQLFANMIEFMNQIDYNAAFQFKKNEMNMMIVDGGNTHLSSIRFEKTEFSDYTIKDLKDENDEKFIYIDISIITNELTIDDSHPIDMYVDTLVKNRFYAVCGKEIAWKQLNSISISDEINAISKKYNSLKDTVKRMIEIPDYQRIVVAQVALSNLIKSLSKKRSKKKDEVVGCHLSLFKDRLTFLIKDEVKGNDIELSGEDILVYPTSIDSSGFNIDYFIKFGKLKTSYTTTMYLHEGLPIIFESRLGGGKIVLYYLIAPRAV